jgi:hypothetical protein
MKQIVYGLIVITFGVLAIVFRDIQSREYIRFQNRVFNFKFGQKEIDMTKFGYLVLGIVFIITGILTLFGIGKIRD